IHEEDVATEMKLWEYKLIMYVLGDDLSMNAVKTFMEKIEMWYYQRDHIPYMDYQCSYVIGNNRLDRISRNPHRNGRNRNNCNRYRNRDRSRNLKHGRAPYFELKEELLRVLPIWIKLPLHLWREKSISKITSALGKPLVT
ncbi:hypothetical protein Lal_00018532, partial [Lupinus albus]